MRYRLDDKRAYRNLCRLYNRAWHDLKGVSTNSSEDERAMYMFTVLSVRLHAAKAKVPIKWGFPGFVRKCGMARGEKTLNTPKPKSITIGDLESLARDLVNVWDVRFTKSPVHRVNEEHLIKETIKKWWRRKR